MNLGPLEEAIQTRLEADTGSGGLFDGIGQPIVEEVSNQFREPDPGLTKPIAVWFADSAQQEDAANMDIVSVLVRFHVLAPHELGTDDARAAVDRIYGDAAAQGGTPTFGLHRWKPSLTSPNGATIMRRLTHSTNHDVNFYEYVDTYSVELTLDFS